MANLTPPRIPQSPRMDDTTFSSVSQSIRNKLGRNHAVEHALDELTRFYNQSQLELATERKNTRIAIDDAMSWQNATTYFFFLDIIVNNSDTFIRHFYGRTSYSEYGLIFINLTRTNSGLNNKKSITDILIKTIK